MPTGIIEILNTGSGHTEIHIDKSNEIELERSKRIIQDMLRRGYVLFVEDKDKKLSRVKEFDAEQGVYIIADLGEEKAEESVEATQPTPKRGRQRKVPMESTKATAIGRSAGG